MKKFNMELPDSIIQGAWDASLQANRSFDELQILNCAVTTIALLQVDARTGRLGPELKHRPMVDTAAYDMVHNRREAMEDRMQLMLDIAAPLMLMENSPFNLSN